LASNPKKNKKICKIFKKMLANPYSEVIINGVIEVLFFLSWFSEAVAS
jgi:hypothetical protein